MLKKAVFTISEYPKAYIGYTNGDDWNGWATPFFEYAEAIKITEGFNECAEYEMKYDEIYEQFYILDTESGELETWQGKDYETSDGIKHLYGIGAYCWIWDEANVISTATSIRNLLLDFDIDVDRKSIYDKLQDFNKLRSAIEILRADEKAEIKIQKLRKELTIMEIGQIIAVNGNLFEYGGIEDARWEKRLAKHKVAVIGNPAKDGDWETLEALEYYKGLLKRYNEWLAENQI